MRICIDATAMGAGKTGTAIYVEEILAVWNQDQSLAHEFVVFVTDNAHRHLSGLNLDHRFRFVSAPANRYLRALWQQVVMPWHIARLRPNVHWGPSFVLPLLCRRPMVVSIHDLTFQLFPEVHEGIKRFYFPAMIRSSVFHAKEILVISDSTRRDLQRLLPASIGKTTVTLLAARPGLITRNQPARDGKPYVLFVGTLEPRKNLRRLIAAWASLLEAERGNTQLVVVGLVGWMVNDLMNEIRTDPSVVFKGYVEDAELASLMAGATALVYPSIYEGFGLPVIEAMAQGIPVLTSDIGATREVALGAAVLVDPASVDSIRQGLAQLLGDSELRDRLSHLGRERAAQFSWQAVASETLRVLAKAAGSEAT